MVPFTSIDAYHDALKNDRSSCVEMVQHYLERIESTRHLNAWIEVFEAEALNRAAELDRQRREGHAMQPLHGVIVGLKDVICYKDHHVTASSRILQGFTSVYHATATERLLDAGAIIIGRNNCDEFAMGSGNENSVYGPVRNAADPDRVPGGSSGGSAVAVQTGSCMISLGSDTGGSVRQPANFCGIYGFKPSYGTISRYGLIAYASSLDQIGIFANTIEDIEHTLKVIAGPDDYDATASQQPLQEAQTENGPFRFCYFDNAFQHPSLDKEMGRQFGDYLVKLRDAGHTVEPVTFSLLDYIVPTYYVLTTAEASSNLSRYDGVRYGLRSAEAGDDLAEMYTQSRSQGFGTEVQRRIMLGTFVLSAGYYDAYFTKAQQVRKLLLEETERIFSQYDAVLMPVSPTPAFRIGEQKDPVEGFLADIYTVYANLVGIPGISLPIFNTSGGLPFGLQAMTSQKNDLLLLLLSKTLARIADR